MCEVHSFQLESCSRAVSEVGTANNGLKFWGIASSSNWPILAWAMSSLMSSSVSSRLNTVNAFGCRASLKPFCCGSKLTVSGATVVVVEWTNGVKVVLETGISVGCRFKDSGITWRFCLSFAGIFILTGRFFRTFLPPFTSFGLLIGLRKLFLHNFFQFSDQLH